MPFAGHPTLGTCHAWLHAGGVPKQPGVIIQQCGLGLIEVRQDGELLAFRAPDLIRSGPLSDAEHTEAARVAGVPEERIVEAVHASNGPKWRMLRLRSAEDVLAAEPISKAPTGTDVGLVGPHTENPDVAWELRAFFADGQGNVVEDPVTGSFNAGVAVHLFASGLATSSYVAAQGQKVGADGRIHCSIDADGAVWVGGRSHTIACGADMTAFA